MPAPTDIRLEIEFSADVWTDVIDDVRTNVPIQYSGGIKSFLPTDRTADPGSLTFWLDNSEQNSAGLLGYYTYGHPNCRAGFALGVGVRLAVDYGGTTYYKGRGTLKGARPEAGTKGARFVECVVVDFIMAMEQHKVSGLSVVQNERSDVFFQRVVDNMPIAPPATSYGTGIETFAVTGDDIKDERQTALSVAQKIALSEFGYVFDNGGTLTFQSRHARVIDQTVRATINNTMRELRVELSDDNVYNRVLAVATPREVGDTPETLFSLQRVEEIGAGASVQLQARYTDPNNRDVRLSGLSIEDPEGINDVPNRGFEVDATGWDANGSDALVWDETADVEELGNPPGDFSGGSPAWDKYNPCDEAATPFGFDSVTDADGDLSTQVAALHDGTRGLQLVFDDANVAYGVLAASAIDQTSLVASFWLDPNGVTLATDKYIDPLRVYDGASGFFGIVRMYNNAGSYTMLAYAQNDSGGYPSTTFTPISDAWHHIMLMMERATAPGANNGVLRLFVDGVETAGSQTTIDNDTKDWDFARFGIAGTNAVTFGGSFFMDEIYLDPLGAPLALTLAAYAGSYGLAVPWLGSAAGSLYVSESAMTDITQGTVEFWVNVDKMVLANGSAFPIASLYDDDNLQAAFYVYVSKDAGGIKLIYYYLDDALAFQLVATSEYVTGWHQVRAAFKAATAAAANNGIVRAWLDGVLLGSTVTADTDALTADTMLVGVISPAATSYGMIYFDTIRWADESGGPIAPVASRVTAEHKYGVASLQLDSGDQTAAAGFPNLRVTTLMTGYAVGNAVHWHLWVKSADAWPASPLIYVDEHDAADALLASQAVGTISTPTAGGTWQRFAGVCTLAQATVAKVRLRIAVPTAQNYSLAGAVQLQVDDVYAINGADLNYEFSSTSAGGGDLDAFLEFADADLVQTALAGNTGEYHLLNVATVTGNITMLRVRGLAIRTYEPATSIREDTDSQDTFGTRELPLQLSYQDSVFAADDWATVVLAGWYLPYMIAVTCSIIGNRSAALMTAALSVDVGERVAIVEDVTGIDFEYFVNGMDFIVINKETIGVTWYLALASTDAYWLLGTAGASELSITTVAGF